MVFVGGTRGNEGCREKLIQKNPFVFRVLKIDLKRECQFADAVDTQTQKLTVKNVLFRFA